MPCRGSNPVLLSLQSSALDHWTTAPQSCPYCIIVPLCPISTLIDHSPTTFLFLLLPLPPPSPSPLCPPSPPPPSPITPTPIHPLLDAARLNTQRLFGDTPRVYRFTLLPCSPIDQMTKSCAAIASKPTSDKLLSSDDPGA